MSIVNKTRSLPVQDANALLEKGLKKLRAIPFQEMSDKINIRLENGTNADVTYSILNCEQIKYSDLPGNIQTTAPNSFLVQVSNPNGIAGLRDMIKRKEVAIAGFTYDVEDSANVTQFAADFRKVHANDVNQTPTSLRKEIDAGKPSNSQEQTVRQVEAPFYLNSNNDLLVTVKTGMVANLTLWAVGVSRHTK